MKFSAAASLFFSGLAATQDVQSKPFGLYLTSKDVTIHNKKVSACHSGAAIESLCIGDEGATFYFNTTKGAEPALEHFTPNGVLVYNLPIEPTPESEAMSFYVDPASNVAQLLFQPGYGNQLVTFDSYKRMAITAYVNDTQTPVKTDKVEALYNWYACNTYYTGYTYRTLAWTLGIEIPQNPSCVKVDVVRKFL